MKKLILCILAFCLPGLALATDLTITMDPPTTYTDGSPILGADTITCTLYGGSMPTNMVVKATGPCTSFVRKAVTPGNACYSATAHSELFNTNSDKVPVVCVVVQQPVTTPPPSQPPSTPQNFKVVPSNG